MELLQDMRRHNISKGFVLCYLVLCACSLVFFNHSLLHINPDWEPYKRIYYETYHIGSWEPGFVTLNLLAKSLGLNYFQFRLVLFCFCCIGVFFLFSAAGQARQRRGSPTLNLALSPLFFFCLAVFFLEFFIVRMRAGICISFFAISLAFFLEKKYVKTVIFSVISLSIHRSTWAIIFSFFCAPYLLLFYMGRARASFNQFWAGSFFFGICLIFVIVSNIKERGEALFSELNPFRLILTSGGPILIFLGAKKIPAAPRWTCVHEVNCLNSIYLFTHLYLMLSVILGLSYSFGFLSNAGEALVRVFSLSTLPAIIIIFVQGGLRKANTAGYLAIANSILFINSLFRIL